MLTRLRVQGFKSLQDVSLDLSQLTVLLGPNASGKSNLLDAVQAFSRIATERTLAEALAPPIRGYPTEAFSLPPGGLAALLERHSAQFSIDAHLEIAVNHQSGLPTDWFQYRVAISIEPSTGRLAVTDEYLKRLKSQASPRIEREGESLVLRRTGKGQPRKEPISQNHTQLSDPRLSAPQYPDVERVRNHLNGWRTYYLDPRQAMRQASPPTEVTDIGTLGESLAPFLYRLKSEYPKYFASIVRTVRNVIPTIREIEVELDPKRGTLDIQVEQDDIRFSSRVISEGTLRVLALCAIAVNPWPASLIAFEEPENGVHPRRIEMIAKLLASIVVQGHQQVIVTTHAPAFVAAMTA